MSEKPYKSKRPNNRIDLNNGNYCPPHRMGEGFIRLTLRGEFTTNEPCHIHKSKPSMILHHNPFCRMLRCPHYKEMREEDKKYREKTK